MKSRGHFQTQLFHGPVESHAGWRCYFSCIILVFSVLGAKSSLAKLCWSFSVSSKQCISAFAVWSWEEICDCTYGGLGWHPYTCTYVHRKVFCMPRKKE